MSIEGKVIVFSGKLSKPRTEMIDEARSKGAIVVKSIRPDLDFIICDIGFHSAQLRKGQQLGIKLITEKEYRKLLEPVKKEE